MPDPQPLGTFPASEATPNPELENMPLEKLTELVEWPTKLVAFAEPPAAPAQPPPVVVPTPEPEPVAAEPAPAEPAPEPEPPVAEADILRARLEAYEADQRKLEAKLAGREAGEKGYIKQLQRQIEDLQRAKPDADDGEPPAQPPPRQPEPNAVATWAVSEAMRSAAATFASEHSDMPEMNEAVTSYLKRVDYDAQPLILSGDPVAASREVTRVLNEAYWHVKAEQKRAHISTLEKRRADSMRGVDEAKRKAATSGAGTPAPPTPPPKQTRDLSTEELTRRVNDIAERRI